MTKKEEQRQKALNLLSMIPIVSTDQVSRFFMCGSPTKRASELLLQLAQEKLIEGKRREVSKTKVWRLSKVGREQRNIQRSPTPFNSMKLNHVLAIGDIYQWLLNNGTLKAFRCELREEFKSGGKKKVYAPDAFFGWNGKAYLLEVQISPLSTTRWAEKWAIVEEYFNEHYKGASWQTVPGKIIKPRLLVVSDQPVEVVQGGSKLQLMVVKDIEALKAP